MKMNGHAVVKKKTEAVNGRHLLICLPESYLTDYTLFQSEKEVRTTAAVDG